MKKVIYKKTILVTVFALIVPWMVYHLGVPPQAEAAQATIEGKIVNIHLGAWRPFVGRPAKLTIKRADGKIFIVYTGAKTTWVPHRSPVVGDHVVCQCGKYTTGTY